MATASTKSRGNKGKGRQANSAPESNRAVNETGNAPPASTQSADGEGGGKLSKRAWWIASAAALVAAAVVRLYQLELRPMHHDEGVNGFFLTNLMRTGIFRYDPSNYHGPTLYYFTLPLAYAAEHYGLFGTILVRLVPVAFGLATVWLALSLRRYIGQVGALAAAALIALSPGIVFFSRYYIHEMMFVFFTLGLVVAALRFYEHDAPKNAPHAPLGIGIAASSLALVASSLVAVYQPNLYPFGLALLIFSASITLVMLRMYDGARSVYLVLAAVSAALLFATKETAFISLGVLLIAWAMAWGYSAFAVRQGWPGAGTTQTGKRARGRKGETVAVAGGAAELRGLVARLGGWTRILILAAAALGIFLFVNILFYSSFFSNPKGVADSLKAFDIWAKTGTSEFHGKPFYMYVKWLFEYESPLLLLASGGALVALWRWRNRFALFAALWGFGLLAAYSLINYKTPWLALSWLVPFAVAGGYAIDALYGRARTLAACVLGLALAVCAYQTYQVNFVNYDDDRYIYVYAHTKREYLDLISEVERIAERAGTKFDTNINVAAPEHWPMPWYLRDYKHVGYHGRVVAATSEAAIIASTKQTAEMQATNGARYQLVGEYPMRPGVTLTLYVRRDLAGR